ncbi:hypothetical protein PTH_2058 [Pelotomaculum thermopropionicum SI]|uniref:Uncharacterized protein n=1 Tax=Pelotomaculum thermopropionicum (strain DSM 13744 / JCM 10971 / SI) TaxID=370438 RepID=A5D0J9_PELTS|nr:hypothetical protein PTH_2058 [Pelotomaculum thermopropionicum SI]
MVPEGGCRGGGILPAGPSAFSGGKRGESARVMLLRITSFSSARHPFS